MDLFRNFTVPSYQSNNIQKKMKLGQQNVLYVLNRDKVVVLFWSLCYRDFPFSIKTHVNTFNFFNLQVMQMKTIKANKMVIIE